MKNNSLFEKEANRIISFAQSHEKIYLYGAGTFGKRLFDFFSEKGIVVCGFIVSIRNKEVFCGKPVYSVEEVEAKITEADGIIPAFENANPIEIKELFANNIDVARVDHLSFLGYITERRFRPIINKLIEEYGMANKLKKGDRIDNILVIRTDAIGDLICTIPFLRELKKNYPNAKLTVIIRKSNELVLKNCPYIDRLWFYDSEMISGEIYEQCESIEQVVLKVKGFSEKYFSNVVFDMVWLPRELMAGRNIFDDILLAFESKAKIRISHVVNTDVMKQCVYETMSDLFTQIVYTDKAKHEIEYQLDMLYETGHTVESRQMELWISDEVQKRIDNLFVDKGIEEYDYKIAIGFVASVPSRTWGYNNYKALFEEAFNEYGNRVKFLVMGGKDALEELTKMEELSKNVVPFVGATSLEESISIVHKCDLYIGSNTGLLHMASACNVPSITIYAELDDGLPTDGDHPKKMGAWGVKHTDMVPPSGLDGCHRVCRMGYPHCISQITPEMVFSEMKGYLG